MTPLSYPLMPPLLINSMLTPSLHDSSMRNFANHVVTLDLTSHFSLDQSCQRRLGRSPLRLNPSLVRNGPPVVHVATTVADVATLLVIARHQSKRVTRPILPPRKMIHLLNFPMVLTNTF